MVSSKVSFVVMEGHCGVCGTLVSIFLSIPHLYINWDDTELFLCYPHSSLTGVVRIHLQIFELAKGEVESWEFELWIFRYRSKGLDRDSWNFERGERRRRRWVCPFIIRSDFCGGTRIRGGYVGVQGRYVVVVYQRFWRGWHRVALLCINSLLVVGSGCE